MIPIQTAIPGLVRVKPGALDRLGIYAERHALRRVAVFVSDGLGAELRGRLEGSLKDRQIDVREIRCVGAASFELAMELFASLPSPLDAIIGFGGGKALDVSKYVAFLAGRPYLAVPTSLSNDGICSPQASLTIDGRRRSLSAAIPQGVIIDTAVCLGAPTALWHSGVGDLVAKFTAVSDWKRAFHAVGTPVDDFAALLSDASVFQFLARPAHDLEGVKLLGTALLLNGISMGICGSSRPASGSEHLISHALDRTSARPRLHGLQVGVAAYLVSLLQRENTAHIARLFDETSFWDSVAGDPFDRGEWLAAARIAPTMKTDFHTVLSTRDCLPEIEDALATDPRLRRCFGA